MFSAFAAFLDEGDEVIVMEPYFDQVRTLYTLRSDK
jgi:aspartate/methionine/tyrosine aminotransferase